VAYPYKKTLGLFVHQHGLLRALLNNGPMFGFSGAPRTVDRHNKNLQEQHLDSIQKRPHHAVQAQTSLT